MRCRASRFDFQPFENLGQSRGIVFERSSQIAEHVLLDSIAMGVRVLVLAGQSLGETGVESIHGRLRDESAKCLACSVQL